MDPPSLDHIFKRILTLIPDKLDECTIKFIQEFSMNATISLDKFFRGKFFNKN
jgi:hypothetical protein